MSVEEIRARWDAATPGPWAARDKRVLWNGEGLVDSQGRVVPTAICDDEDDAEAIAHAPTDIAFLLGEVARLRDVLNYMTAPTMSLPRPMDDADIAAFIRTDARESDVRAALATCVGMARRALEETS